MLHGFVKIDTRICQSCYMDLSKLINGFFEVDTWISQSCYMFFFLNLVLGFVIVVICTFLPLPNKTKLTFDQNFKAGWSFCFELKGVVWVKVLNALGPLCLKQCQILKRQVLFPVLEHFLGNVLKQGEQFFLESRLYPVAFKSPQNIVQVIIWLLISVGEDPVLPATRYNFSVMHSKKSW